MASFGISSVVPYPMIFWLLMILKVPSSFTSKMNLEPDTTYELTRIDAKK